MTQQIERSFFSTRALPPQHRLPAWREGISSLFDIRTQSTCPEDRFNASLSNFLLNQQIILSHCETHSQRFERGSLRLARDGLDYYLIQTHLSGSQELRRGSKQVKAGPGDLLILDLAEQHEATTTDFSHLTLVVPRYLLAPQLLQPDSQQGRVLRSNHSLTAIAVQHLHMLGRHVSTLRPEESLQLIEPTLMLLASALNGSVDSTEKGTGSVAISLMTKAREEIERQLTHQFTVDGLCRRLRISRTVLYRLFEPLGGVRHYIQERRLRRCAEALALPRNAGRKIFQIAFDWGFRSEAHFTRAFRRKYGISPSEARYVFNATEFNAPASLAMADSVVGDRHYEQWLRQTLKAG